MNNNYAMELFIKRLSRIYEQNPNLDISADTIYSELMSFNTTSSGIYEPIPRENLVGIQLKLKNHFEKNQDAHTFSSRDGYFWVIENRLGKSYSEFQTKITSSVKIYVPVISKDLYYVATNLFTFMLSKGIMMQCKVAKDLRNDTLVLRVATPRDALLVEDYISNELHYHNTIKPSPFTLNNGKVGYALDGNLSYNSTLSKKLLFAYLQNKKASHSLKMASLSDFLTFLEKEMTSLRLSSSASLSKYHLDTQDQYSDFTMILELIIKNIKGTLTLSELFSHHELLRLQKSSPSLMEEQNQSRSKLLTILGKLSNIYSTDDIHKIIMEYIKTGNARYFTREGQIRYTVQMNFTPKSMKEEIKKLGWEALILAYQTTYEKYGYDQATMAIKELMENGKLDYFTNDSNRRSYLSLIIPTPLLKELIINKISSTDEITISNSLSQYLQQTKEYTAIK